MTSVKKVTPGGYMTIYLALTVTVIMAPVSCFDRGLSVSGNLTGNRMRHGYRNG